MNGRLADTLKAAAATAAAVVVLGAIVLRVTSCAPVPSKVPMPASIAPPPVVAEGCDAPGWGKAAQTNAGSLRQLPWAPFGRTEWGWEIYAPLIAREIGVRCAPDTAGFARALAAWEARQGLAADGLVSEQTFIRLKGVVQSRRPFVLLSAEGVCAAPADEASLASSTPAEGYGAKVVQLRPGVLDAYRRMVQAAKAEAPAIAEDPQSLALFSGYRSPAYDAARCQAEGNCNGLVRATCSPHRTGLALDLYVGHAPGYAIDSSADPNRLAMTKTPAYRWLLANAHRFGFVNYPFEPWHWEWTGEPPKAP